MAASLTVLGDGRRKCSPAPPAPTIAVRSLEELATNGFQRHAAAVANQRHATQRDAIASAAMRGGAQRVPRLCAAYNT